VKSNKKKKRSIEELLKDDELITRALAEGVQAALRMHKRMGNPVCECKDGKIIWIKPEDIPDNIM